ncbi:histidine kinase, partial [bacterium]|nr:histidine kinase [bacterium]
MLTAIRTDISSKIRGLDAGADAFLTKPIEPNELSAQINVMLRIKDAEDKLRAEKVSLESVVLNRTKELREINEKLKLEITERKQAEEQIRENLKEKEIMLKEIHHRVKNNLQIMSSLLRLQSAKINDECISEILNESQSRIQSMSIVHEMMYQNQDFVRIDMKCYINTLINFLILLYHQNDEGVKIIDNSKNVQLDLNRA